MGFSVNTQVELGFQLWLVKAGESCTCCSWFKVGGSNIPGDDGKINTIGESEGENINLQK